jgi:hypothetical protein
MPIHPRTKTYVLSLRRTVKSSLPRLIEAIQNPKELHRWCNHSAFVDPSLNGKFIISDDMKGEIIEMIPQDLWRIEWNNPKYPLGTEVVFDFKKRGRWESTLFIRHCKMKTKKEYEETYEMWLSFLDSLQNYLEKGRFEYDD